MKIGIICGHGQNHYGNKAFDAGATSAKWGTEAAMVRDLAPRLKSALLNFENVSVDILDMSKNWYDFLKYNGYNFSNYDYIIELHANAGAHDPNGNGVTTGVEVWVTPREKAVVVEQSICNELAKLGFRNRGVKRENFLVINCIKDDGVSACLIECGFIDDNDDMSSYFGNKDGFAKAIASGVGKGFKLVEKQKPVAPIKPSTNVESYTGYVEVIYGGADGLDVHSTPTFEGNVAAVAKKGDVFTVVGRVKVDGVYMYKLKSGLYITSAKEYVSYRTTLHGSASNPAPALTPIQLEAAANNMKVAIDIPNGSHFWISEHSTVYGGAAYGKPIPSSIKKATTRYTSGGQRFDHGAKWVLAKEIMAWVKVSECLVK